MYVLAQQIDRIVVAGEIVVSQEEDREGVSIYNESSQKGTVSDEEGNFTLAVALGDRIEITALQFQSFKRIVDKGVIENKKMKIFLNPYVNKLDAVLLSSHNLTGIVTIDAKNIDVIAVPDIELSFDANADFAPDRFSRIQGNVAQEALGYGNMANGLNVGAIVGLILKSVFPKKGKKAYVDPFAEKATLVKALQSKYSTEYFSKTFGLPIEKVDDFIYFAEENALQLYMLKPENEMELLEVLFKQSELYKARLTDKK